MGISIVSMGISTEGGNDLHYLTMTRYDDSFKGIGIVFDKEHVHMSMGEVICRAGLKQLRIAETEKYAHVTFFFSGGREVQSFRMLPT